MRKTGIAFCAIALGAFGTAASAATVSFGNTFSPVVVVDASTASRSIDVTTSGLITDLNVIVDFSQSGDSIASDGSVASTAFPYPDELSLVLQSAQGTSVTLVASGTYGNGTSGRYVFTFDDEATTSYTGSTTSGTYLPNTPLSAFDGQDMLGIWTITIGDYAGADPKSLNAITLDFTYDLATIPLPAGAPLLLGGLTVLGLKRRRQG